MQFLSQSKIDKRNLKLIPDVGNIIPYRQLETFLFGGHVPELNRMLLLHRGFVLEDENNDLFFKLSKMEKFLEFSFDNIDFTKNTICPINYLSLVKFDKNLTLTTKMDRLINIMLDFKIFLQNKNELNSKSLLNYFWDDRFNGIVCETSEEPYMITIKFPKINKPFIMVISEYMNSYKTSISLNSLGEDRLEEFEKVYKTWVQEVLMDNPDDYIVSCLNNVTGNEDFSRMIFNSHKEKTNYTLALSDLDMILDFKNKKSQESYHAYFMRIYPNLIKLVDSNLFVNFEGFNKYLLNIEKDYLSNFESKERINTLYYNVMDELVNSYQRLYTHTKLI